MFGFMEGLPRAGKSYETCAYYIVPALKEGRTVVAYIEGLNHEKFAEVTGLPLPIIKKLLIPVTVEQVPEIYKYAIKDALIVIDEMQDFWPTSRQTLSPEMTKFITQHGHDGLDIIGMGQDLNDVHKLWRNRCARKIIFQKLDGVGRDSSYAWTAFAAVRGKNGIAFRKAQSGIRKYQSEYFGLYASHTEGTSNFATFKDDRTNMMKGKTYTLGIPVLLVATVFAIYTLSNVFSGEALAAQETPVTTPVTKKEVPGQSSEFQKLEDRFNSKPLQTVNVTEPELIDPDDYVHSIASEYRLRLSGYVRAKGRVIAEVQAFDSSYRLKERFYSDELVSMGWELHIKDHGLLISKGDIEYLVRSWPIEPFGKLGKSSINAAQL